MNAYTNIVMKPFSVTYCEVSCMFCSNDVSEKVDELSLESDDDDDRARPVSKFGLLNIEDAGGSDSEPDSDTVSRTTKQTKKTAPTRAEDKTSNRGAAKKQGNKGKVDTKKAKDEEDIDELLAELDAPKPAKSGEKKDRKKKKGGGNVEDVIDPADTMSTQPDVPATVEPEIDYKNMTQDEIARLMEEQYGEDSEEERKKARAKKKKGKAKDEMKQMEDNEMDKLSGETVDKPSVQVGEAEEKNADADVDVEVTKPAKKQNKTPQRKQSEVLFILLLFAFIM